MKDIIYDESELSIAANKIQREGEMLAEVIEKYINIMEKISQQGVIKDRLITTNILHIIENVKPLGAEIIDITNNITELTQASLKQVRSKDEFNVISLEAFERMSSFLNFFVK